MEPRKRVLGPLGEAGRLVEKHEGKLGSMDENAELRPGFRGVRASSSALLAPTPEAKS